MGVSRVDKPPIYIEEDPAEDVDVMKNDIGIV
jgi:hypothetical protein